MPPTSVFFISDAHLGAENAEREAARTARLHDFLNSLPGRASSLYILGDLFEFWFEYGTAIPRRCFPTLAVLDGLRAAGVDIAYMRGNHDWPGTFFHDTLGMRTLEGPVTVEAQGRRLWLHHGDGLVGGDLGYKLLLRPLLRSPISAALYRLVPPDLGIPLAHAVSRWSRHSRGVGELRPEPLWREIAEPAFRSGHDAAIIGHFHHAYERREPGREFFLLGDWIERFTYVELADGRLELKTWPAPA